GKLVEAAAQFEKDKPTFVVELGDLIDAADSVETEQRYLKTINREFSVISQDRHCVLGNHCVTRSPRPSSWAAWSNRSRTTHSTGAISISWFWTPASAATVSRMAGRTPSGMTPTSPLLNWSGCKQT